MISMVMFQGLTFFKGTLLNLKKLVQAPSSNFNKLHTIPIVIPIRMKTLLLQPFGIWNDVAWNMTEWLQNDTADINIQIFKE